MSTISTSAPTKVSLQKETKAGNYFVSNYPPYSFWKPEFTGEALGAMERPHTTGTPLGIYAHIPFCRKRCHFCYFKVYTDKDSTETLNLELLRTKAVKEPVKGSIIFNFGGPGATGKEDFAYYGRRLLA